MSALAAKQMQLSKYWKKIHIPSVFVLVTLVARRNGVELHGRPPQPAYLRGQAAYMTTDRRAKAQQPTQQKNDRSPLR